MSEPRTMVARRTPRALDRFRAHEAPQPRPRMWPAFMRDLAAQVAAHVPLWRSVNPARDLAEMMRQEAAETPRVPS